MDSETIAQVETTVRTVADEHGYQVAELVVFGSRARDDYRDDSDIDVLIVSPAFEGMDTLSRPGVFYDGWDYEALPEPEFICLTPEEFERAGRKDPNIVRTAVEEGVRL